MTALIQTKRAPSATRYAVEKLPTCFAVVADGRVVPVSFHASRAAAERQIRLLNTMGREARHDQG